MTATGWRHPEDRSPDPLEHSVRQAELRWLETWVRGPVDVRVATTPVQVGDPAPDHLVQDWEGRWRRMSDFWKSRPALIVFLRPLGCRCCHLRAARLRWESRVLEPVANVVAVSQADPPRAADFRRRWSLEMPVLCDSDLEVHLDYGLREGTLAEVLFDSATLDHDRAAGLALIEAGRATGVRRADNPWILPGEFLVDASGTIRLAYRYQHRCQIPEFELLLRAVEAVVEGR
jgi:peroxiredoxin